MVDNEPALEVSREDPEERLLIEAAQRDPAMFGLLYENNFERVYAYIRRRVRDRDATEDLTAEVFRKALENLPRYKWRGVPFAAWLLRVAANMIADRFKRAARERDLSNEDSVFDVTSEVNLENAEKTAQLFRLVRQLPADQRRVIELRFAAEKSIREIAQELGRTEGAIKQLQFRGLENLRSQVGKSLGE